MLLWSLSFLIGDCLLNSVAILPALPYGYGAILLGLGLLLFCNRYLNKFKNITFIIRICCIAVLGWGWALLHAVWQQEKILPYELEGKPLFVQGVIISIPEYRTGAMAFDFLITEYIDNNILKEQRRVKLSWYGKELPELHVGEHWQLLLILKRPHSVLNPGGFDYERWLFEHGISAQGYVKASNTNIRLRTATFSFNKLREQLNTSIQNSLSAKEGKGLIAALVVGMRDHITSSQWSTMQATGTNHLMAIAGLHIGFVSGFAYFLSGWCWRRSAHLPLLIPTPQIAAVFALLAAFLYSALAGFALPTQRAVIMTAVFLAATLFKKHLPLWQAWSLALLIILVVEPLAILSDSFWLSFGSVAIILYGSSYRLKPSGIWWKYFHIQWIITIGFIPLTLYFFQSISLTSFIANALAIPWVGFIVLPLSLLGGIIYFCYPPLAALLWQMAESLLMLLWQLLDRLAHLSSLQWQTYIPSYSILIATIMGFLLLIAPRGLPARWVGLIWILPAIKGQLPGPNQHELWFTLLDVGQGLSAVVQTAHHTLIFDTGPKYSAELDMGNAVVVPFLRAKGIQLIDTLIISHADNDHSGGAESILNAIFVKEVFNSYGKIFPVKLNQFCRAGITWQWDNAQFEFINPGYFQGNNNSCVLRINFGKNSILLPGDIEKKAEQYLVRQYADRLASTIIVVPHHGSLSSSSPDFINAVTPRYALFAVGYRNRFHFPKPQIITRYRQINAVPYQTDTSGAITFKLHDDYSIMVLEEYRKLAGHFWNQ